MLKAKHIILMTVIFILFLPVFVLAAGTIELPKTGQMTCYDWLSTAVIPCAGTGQDGEIQAGVPWPSPRFTNNGDGTITDNLTGLMWTQDGNAPGPVACSPAVTKTWQQALDYVACLNANSYLGYTDWHLPNINEFKSLTHYGQSYTVGWLIGQGFNNVLPNYFYWSSTSYASLLGFAWIIDMWHGYLGYYKKSYYTGCVWPVRSGQYRLIGTSSIQLPGTGQTSCYDSVGTEIPCAGTGQDGDTKAGLQWPNPRFTDNGNSTVTDNLTGLVWTKDGNTPGPTVCSPAATKTWQGALDFVACLNANSYIGYTDWRLPNINELKSLTHAGQYNTATWLNTEGFNNVQSYYYWSSTFYPVLSGYAWIVNMWYGSAYDHYTSDYYYVWPVRSGQVAPLIHSIIGSVTENGTGLGNVTMTLSGTNSATTTTATDGSYSFTNLADGNYTVTPSLSKYNFTPPNLPVILTGADATAQDFTAVQTWFEENDPAITYTGTWSNIACVYFSAGGASISNTTGSKTDFSFTGTGIKWIVLKGPMMGKASVYLDGVNMGLVDLYSPALNFQVILPKTGLTPGVHTVTLEVSANKNTASTGTYINIDAFEVVP